MSLPVLLQIAGAGFPAPRHILRQTVSIPKRSREKIRVSSMSFRSCQ
jgi:hypothetical protein